MGRKVKLARKWFNSNTEEAKQEMIGIVGTGRSVGVTHFAVMTAGYLSGVLRKRCAVLEWNSHGDFGRIRTLCKKEKSSQGFFRILEADYYENAGIETLFLCKKFEYQAVIVDYGMVTEGNLEEFLRCHRQFVLGSVSEWQINEFLEFVARGGKQEKSWRTLVSFGSEEARKSMEKRFKFPVNRIPVSVDAFVVTGENISFYQQFF